MSFAWDIIDSSLFIDSIVAFQNDEELPSSPSIDPPEKNSPKDITTMQSELICGVCGASAHGYNFDRITCESCKAFFRRNALKNTTGWICRYSGSCEINVTTRRHCAYCRLKKCFQIGMRKDWIRTEHERNYRRMQQVLKEQKRLQKNNK